MKKISILFGLLAALMLSATFTSCSDDDNNPTPTPAGPTVAPYHFDLVVTVGKHGGMNRDKNGHIQLSIDSLTAGSHQIDFRGMGAEITDYTTEAILRGKYYYQVPNSGERFTKFQFTQNHVNIIQEQPFAINTYSPRGYTHAWTSDSTLIIMSANGAKDHIIWTRLNTNDMTIEAEGVLGISLLEGYDNFTSSGILAYRESDNTLFYFYYNKVKGTTSMNASNEPHFHVAAINATTMNVISDVDNTEAAEMAGSAYGELLQNIVFFDEQDNLYLAAFSDTEVGEEGSLLRIDNGTFNFHAGYNGFPNPDGKLLTVQYLGNGKVLSYSRDDQSGNGTGIDSYAHYYSIIDLNAQTRQRLSYEGVEIPFSSGRFSQRTAIAEGKAYIGVNTQDSNPVIYIYDIATGTVTRGAEIAEGYFFDQIRVVED